MKEKKHPKKMYQDAMFLVLLWMWLGGIEQWNKLYCLGYIGDYTTQLNRDYDKPLEGSILNNKYIGKQEKYKMFLIRCTIMQNLPI